MIYNRQKLMMGNSFGNRCIAEPLGLELVVSETQTFPLGRGNIRILAGKLLYLFLGVLVIYKWLVICCTKWRRRPQIFTVIYGN